MKKSTSSLNVKNKISVKAILFGCAILCPALMFINSASAMFSGSEDFDLLDSFYEKNYSTEATDPSVSLNNKKPNLYAQNYSVKEVFGEESDDSNRPKKPIDIENLFTPTPEEQANFNCMKHFSDSAHEFLNAYATYPIYGQDGLFKKAESALEKVEDVAPELDIFRKRLLRAAEKTNEAISAEDKRSKRLIENYKGNYPTYKEDICQLNNNLHKKVKSDIDELSRCCKTASSGPENLPDDNYNESDKKIKYLLWLGLDCMTDARDGAMRIGQIDRTINLIRDNSRVYNEAVNIYNNSPTKEELVETQISQYNGDYPTYKEDLNEITEEYCEDRDNAINLFTNDCINDDNEYHNIEALTNRLASIGQNYQNDLIDLDARAYEYDFNNYDSLYNSLCEYFNKD